MKDPTLWQRLQDYGCPLSGERGNLQQHLFHRTKLDRDQSARTVEEYRRFLYLAATSGEVVAPSPLIDRVWHTHIEDTRAYESFSKDVVGRVIHHSPGRQTAAEDSAYQRTLDFYEREFLEPPFARVWPSQKWLQGESLRGKAFMAMLIGSALLSFVVDFPLPFVVWPMTFAVGYVVETRWGSWSVRATSDGSGCSSCGSDGGDGGCGGD